MSPNQQDPSRDQAGKPAYRNLIDEADIGSGERTPGQQETDDMVREIGRARAAQDPEAERVGTAHDLVDDIADTGGQSGQQTRTSDVDSNLPPESRTPGNRTVEQEEDGSLMRDRDVVPPKGN